MAALTKVKINNIDTTIEWITDPITLFNAKATQANIDVGFIFNRNSGLSSNIALYWNETTQKVTIGYTPDSGLPNSNIALSSYANVAAAWYYGNLAGGTTGVTYVTGHVLPTSNVTYDLGSPTLRFRTGYFSAATIDLGGSQISVDPVNGFKFTVGGTGTPTYLASNGLIAGSSLSSTGTISADGSINTKANVLASQVSAGSVVTTGVINAGGNLLAQTAVLNYLDVNGNVDIGAITTPGAGHTIVGNVIQSGAGTVYYNTPGNIMAALGRFGQVSSDGLINTSANVMAATGRFGTVLSDGFINTSANVSAALHTGGSVVVSGVINTASNVLTSQITVFGNATIGAISTAGVVHSIVGNVQQSGAGTIFFNTPGNIMAAIGRFGSISTDGYINTSANISAAQINAGQINTTGNILSTGAVHNALTVNGATTQSGTLTVSSGFVNVTGNIVASTANFGLLNSTGNILATAGTFNGLTVNGNTFVNSRFVAQYGNLSTFQVGTNGYAGLNINPIYNFDVFAPGTAGTVMRIGSSYSQSNYMATALLTEAIYTAGIDITYGKEAFSGSEYSSAANTYPYSLRTYGINRVTIAGDGSNVTVNITTPSTSTTTGALIVKGGVGVAGNVSATNLTGTLTTASQPAITTVGNLSSLSVVGVTNHYGVTKINDTTPAIPYQLGSGAFYVAGGMSVGQDIWVGGNLFVANIVSQSTTILSVTSPLVYLQTNITYPYNYDIGFYSHFTGGTGNNYQHTGMVRNDADSAWYLFSNVAEPAAGQVTFDANTVYDTLISGTHIPGINVRYNLGNTISYYGNAYVNNIYGININGTLQTAAQPNITSVGVLTSLNTSGNVLATSGIFNSLTVNGGVTSTGFINTSGNVSAVVHTGGSVSVTGLINTIGNISGAQVNAGQINTTGNVLATGGVFNALTVNGNETVTGFLNTAGNIISTGAIHNSLTVNGNATATGYTITPVLTTTSGTNANLTIDPDGVGWLLTSVSTPVSILNTATSTTTSNGALVVSGGIGVFGNINAGSLTTPGSQHVLFGNVQINAIGAIQVPVGTTLQRPGTNIAGQIRFNTDTNQFEGYSNVWGAISGGGGGGGTPGGVTSTIQYNNGGAFGGIGTMNYILANGAIIISTGTSSTTTGTGALQIIGGVGITENINAGGTVKVTGAINTAANVLASQVSAGSVITTGVVNAGGNVLAQTGIFNFLDVNGNVQIGDIGTPGAGHSIIGNVLQTGAGTIFYNTIGNVSASEGKFNTLGLTGTLSSSAFVNTSGNVSAATVIAGAVTATGTITASLFNSTGNVLASGAIFNTLAVNSTVGSSLSPTTSNTYTLGSSTNWWSTVWGKAVNAAYADLAETYSSDRNYIPGTVLVFGGTKEVTVSTQSHDPAIAGVVSTNPAYLMNAQADGVAVALQGRVPCRVLGPVEKGDRVVTSDVRGVAERLDMSKYQPGCIIGKSLESVPDGEIATIEVVVGRV